MSRLNSSKSPGKIIQGLSRLYLHSELGGQFAGNRPFCRHFSSNPDLYAPFREISPRNSFSEHEFSCLSSLGYHIASNAPRKPQFFSPIPGKRPFDGIFRFYSQTLRNSESMISSNKISVFKVDKGDLMGFKKPLNSKIQGRFFSAIKSSESGKIASAELSRWGFKPLESAKSALSGYREAVGLHVEAFWKRNYLVVVGAVGVGLCIILWRIMFGIASLFVGLSEGMAKYGFLALASAIVAFSGLYIRSRFTVNPDKMYRMAMRRLNTSAGILEVMGAPLSGTDVRAYVMSGGGLRMKNFRPRLSSKRCFLIFPIRGSERKGLVSVEVKKKHGQYDMRLLAVDIPMSTGADQRLFLAGDEEEYKIGGGLISELRDPIIKAMAAEKEFEDLDQKEEEEDARRELQEEERKRREEIEKIERNGS